MAKFAGAGAGLLALAGAVFLLSKNASATENFLTPAITQDPASWPAGDRVWDVCRAVAMAEGFNDGPGHAPFDLNNPGDLSPGDEAGQATAGPAEFHDGSHIIHFATAAGGFQALYHKFYDAAAGVSRVYDPAMTWEQIGSLYAGDAGDWIRNVTGFLGVDPGSTLGDYVGAL